jgi:hypothetical protein
MPVGLQIETITNWKHSGTPLQTLTRRLWITAMPIKTNQWSTNKSIGNTNKNKSNEIKTLMTYNHHNKWLFPSGTAICCI